MYRILSNCSGTLRELKLATLTGFDEGLLKFNDNSQEHPDIDPTKRPRWSLPHIKSLQLVLDGYQPKASAFLPCVCPELESIQIMIVDDLYPSAQLVSTLKEHCPKLHRIHLDVDMACFLHGYSENPNPKAYASLIKDTCRPQGLQFALMTLPTGLDDLMKDALLFHTDSLVTLEIEEVGRSN